MLHKNASLGDQHLIHNWEYADATARGAASGFVTADLKKVALQLSDNSFWVLTAVTPTWGAIAGAALPVADTTGIAKGSVDGTKIVRLEVDGLTTGTTRVLTVPDADMILAGKDIVQTFTGGQRGAVTALTSTTAAMAIDLAANNNFSHTTSENTTLSAPSNAVAGQSGVITITQGATARTLAFNTFWKFAGGTVPTLTATVGAVDVFAYNVESATRATCQLLKDVK